MTETTLERFLALALAGDRHAAVRTSLDLLDAGIPAPVVIAELLAAAQREVGARWQRAEWTTADEHVVTSVTQAALEAVSSAAPQDDTSGVVVVTCAEGDWHSLPAQMFAEQLRSRGQGARFLGASTPVEDVGRYLARERPDGLTITCNLSLSFSGTARLAAEAHRHGVPVLVGGRAVTPDRAAILGADTWAADVDAAAAVLQRWRTDPPQLPAAPVPLDAAALELEASAASLADDAFPLLERRFPPLRGYDHRQRARTREDLVYIVRYLAAARLVDDPEVFVTFARWLGDLLVARGVPLAALHAGFASLAPGLLEVDEAAHRMLVDAGA